MLRAGLPRVKFIVESDVIKDVIRPDHVDLLSPYEQTSLSFTLDHYLRQNGAVDTDRLGEAASTALSRPVVAAVQQVQSNEGGSGLCVIHKFIPRPTPAGGAEAYVAHNDSVELLGQLRFDSSCLKHVFEARTTWVL